METDFKPLALDEVSRVRFERNTIRQAFRELRFPTLPDLANDAPRAFVMAIRRAFPHYERRMDLKMGITDKGMEQIPQATHRFVSNDRAWVTWLRTSSFGVETRAYTDFTDFLSRVAQVIDGAQPCLDTDFFTRLGLRYINVLPAEIGDIDGWVNDTLLGPMKFGPMTGANRWSSEVSGLTDTGTYSFRYGLLSVEGEGQRYVLDADFAAESVEWGDALSYLRHFNELNFYLYSWSIDFYLYSWSIGPRTRAYLGRVIE
jgi:uncharacterized protein (TIGR04255 family)